MIEQVTSVEQLRKLLEEGVHEYFIRLNCGLRSSKTIDDYDDGEIWVENHIDGTVTPLSDTNIYEAMKKGAFCAEIEEPSDRWFDDALYALDIAYPDDDGAMKYDFVLDHWQNLASDEENIATYEKYRRGEF